LKTQLIYLVRHGKTQNNVDDVYQDPKKEISLNANGRQQAKQLGQFLRKHYEKPAIVYSSSANRALETACIIEHEIFGASKKKHVEMCSMPDFYEINHGELSGKKHSEIPTLYPELYKMWLEDPWHVKFPCGEFMVKSAHRILGAWQKIMTFREGHILVVGHVIANLIVLAHIIDTQNLWFGWQDNACLNVISREENGKLKVRLLNSTAHLF